MAGPKKVPLLVKKSKKKTNVVIHRTTDTTTSAPVQPKKVVTAKTVKIQKCKPEPTPEIEPRPEPELTPESEVISGPEVEADPEATEVTPEVQEEADLEADVDVDADAESDTEEPETGPIEVPKGVEDEAVETDGIKVEGDKEIFVEDGLFIDVEEKGKIPIKITKKVDNEGSGSGSGSESGAEADDDNEEYVTLSQEELEEQIDNLELRKYKLKKQYRTIKDEGKEDKALKAQLKEVCRLLGKFKRIDIGRGVDENVRDKKRIENEFKRKEKKYKLPLSDFKKVIDLTAPKEEREPEESTERIWHRSKSVVFKNKTYRPAKPEKLEKFKKKMKLKTMSPRMKKKLDKQKDGNLNSINLHHNNSQILNYQQYDPTNFKGLYLY